MQLILGSYLSEPEAAFNAMMLEPRLTVEWGFMRVSQLWQCFQRPAFLQVWRQPLGQVYLIAVMLTNIRTCLTGRNKISDYFSCLPPTCEAYLGIDD